MQYRNLGQSGLKVSSVSLGNWLTMGKAIDQKTSDDLVGTAIDSGINFLDTADIYNIGEGELALGKAIQGRRREDLVIASKCFFPMSEGVNDRGLSRKHIHESVKGSLKRLGTDYLDLYQCHRPDPDTTVQETVMAMDDLIRQGHILYWGVSMWPADLIVAAVQLARTHGWHQPVSNQPRYNLLDRSIEEAVIPASTKHGVGQVVFSPLAQGVLSGKYRVGEEAPEGTRASDERVNQFIGQFMTDDVLSRVAKFVELAGETGMKPTQLALAWCLRQENVSSVIVGATSAHQLQENAASSDLQVDPSLWEKLDTLFS
jgi:voltage-dependent potassium channel beta subunit